MTAVSVATRSRLRIHQLDAVRGVLAIGVMFYHALGTPQVPLGFGTWGVYAFFVLSGFALEHVYGDDLKPGPFAVARIARLAPLWIPVVLISATRFDEMTVGRVLLNATGLFGFVNPGATSVVRGGWSIGVEVVCYVLFVVVAWRRLPTAVLVALTALALAYRVWYLGWAWNGDLPGDWSDYTQAPAFFVFFLGGMVGARVRLNGLWPFPVGCALIAVTLMSDVTGMASPWLALASIVGVGLAGAGAAWSGWPARIADRLGDLSYGTYLLHPLMLIWLPKLWLLTPLVALAVHRWYEVPAGRRVRRALTRSPRPRPGPDALAADGVEARGLPPAGGLG